jgi:hypothetical protein
VFQDPTPSLTLDLREETSRELSAYEPFVYAVQAAVSKPCNYSALTSEAYAKLDQKHKNFIDKNF